MPDPTPQADYSASPLAPTAPGSRLSGAPATATPGRRLLARLERAGAIDAALALLAAAQLWYLADHPRNPERYPGAATIVLTLATWVLLALGALAPLMRRPVPRRGDLPSGAGATLAAYALMALAWIIIVLNVDPEAWWGFWHLARLDAPEFAVFVTAVPLALAPCWRRLATAARRRLRLATRRRPAWAMAARLAGLAALAAFIALARDHAVTSDGWGFIGAMPYVPDLNPNQYREAGLYYIFAAAGRLLAPLGLSPLQAIGLTSTAAILGVLTLLGWLMRAWKLTPRQRKLGWLMAAATPGMMQFLLGRIEGYGLVQLGIAAPLVCAVVAIGRAGEHPGAPDRARARFAGFGPLALGSFAYAVALAAHLSLIFIAPALLWAIWRWSAAVAARAGGESAATAQRRRVRRAALTRAFTPAFTRALGWLLACGLVIHLAWWGWLMLRLDPPTPVELVRAVTTSLNTGGEHETFIGSSAPTLAAQARLILAPGNLFKVVQLLFLVAGGPLLAAVVIAAGARAIGARTRATRRLGRPGHARPQCNAPPGNPGLSTLALAWACFLVYALTWRNDWAWQEDWDLFSGIAVLSWLLAARLLLPARGVVRAPARLVRQACLFALALGLTQHWFYYSRVGFLNAMNKVSYGWLHQLPIQDYQARHQYEAGTRFEVRDGRLIIMPPRKAEP